MSQLNILLQAVLADPEDDLVRLAYADALEEEGDTDRASFIRQQIASGEMLVDMVVDHHVIWRRGFIDELSLTIRELVKKEFLQEMIKMHPVRRVNLKDRDSGVASANADFGTAGWYTHLGEAARSEDYDFLDLSKNRLPHELWILLNGNRWNAQNQYWRNYQTVEEANADLSQACLRYARGER